LPPPPPPVDEPAIDEPTDAPTEAATAVPTTTDIEVVRAPMASDENVGFGSGARVNVNEVMSESTLPNAE
jgi:hypothetical protein